MIRNPRSMQSRGVDRAKLGCEETAFKLPTGLTKRSWTTEGEGRVGFHREQVLELELEERLC